jgi:hypothetical protein
MLFCVLRRRIYPHEHRDSVGHFVSSQQYTVMLTLTQQLLIINESKLNRR